MKIKTYLTTTTLALATAAAILCVAPPEAVGAKVKKPKIATPKSQVQHNSLKEWMTLYWEWHYSGADMAQSQVGDVQLMPLPAGVETGGSGTPEDPTVYEGQLEITIPEGTSIVLPEFAWGAERYEGYPDVPDDPSIDDKTLLASVHPTLTIDGVPVLTDANKARYYVPVTFFDEPIVYAAPTDYGSVAALSYQGCAVVIEPLSVGQHTIHLYEPWILDWWYMSWAVVYDNTWHVTVTPKKPANHAVVPPQSKPFGKTYGEWSAAWWQWAYSLPVDQNPFFDETGCQNGANGQSGPVWFLTGVISVSGTAERTCTVPFGKMLFFPILNVECATLEDNGETEAELRACTQGFMDGGISGLACELDGAPIQNIERYRAPSPLFYYGPLPENNVPLWSGFPKCVPGAVSASVADGFYLMLKPLKRGEHTLHFTGMWVAYNFTLDITYHLTVQ